ncbi:hypothetical protein [Rhizobium rhizophilum]|uniref:Conjugal transfer protein TrbH n=1 Tax=Rhizobium rhizophilum TaxID=1850373 RepID=A0ABY2QU25_9HYPH|nr:hypothetical protein [Rhizobium rhizophilum]THV12742.1 hypothetical protein E9677_18680 [Rhizobium rhizophilum]
MNQSAGFLFVALVLCGCQTTSGGEVRENREEGALRNPAIAASIASDLSGDLAPFIPQGSAVAFGADETQPLSYALSEALIRQGYRSGGDDDRAQEAIQLRIWSAEVEGDLLVRLSTPSHRLSKVYRQGGTNHGGNPDPVQSGSVFPAGPLLVETMTGGASS